MSVSRIAVALTLVTLTACGGSRSISQTGSGGNQYTRQVQALESLGLAQRSTDPTDRRASILDLTDEGRDALERTRRRRRDRLRQALSDWEPSDREEFARLLTKFNESVEGLLLADAR